MAGLLAHHGCVGLEMTSLHPQEAPHRRVRSNEPAPHRGSRKTPICQPHHDLVRAMHDGRTHGARGCSVPAPATTTAPSLTHSKRMDALGERGMTRGESPLRGERVLRSRGTLRPERGMRQGNGLVSRCVQSRLLREGEDEIVALGLGFHSLPPQVVAR
jgi:hypothetical protein